jgi:hypothetical protein
MLIFLNKINLRQFAEHDIVLNKLGIPFRWIREPAAIGLLADIEDLFLDRVDSPVSQIKPLADLKNLKRLCLDFDSYSYSKERVHEDLEQFFLEKGIKLEWGPNRQW